MAKLRKQTRRLIGKMNRAFSEYPMLADGDRVAVAVSGGHDSMSLIRLLQIRQTVMPENYEIIPVHIKGNIYGPDASLHQPLIDWLEETGLEYIVKPMQLADGEKLPMNCQRCSWNRRSTLFRIANRSGCNKIAFGHHFDDMVETALLNLLHQGRMASMFPYASYFGGKFSLIRPLMYITKKELENFARINELPEPPPQCPNSDTSQRKVMGGILSLADKSYQDMRWNIFRAAMRCMKLEEEKKGNDLKNWGRINETNERV